MDAIFCERKISFLLMPNSANPAQILDEVLGRRAHPCLLEERGVEVPHLVITVTLEGQVVLRSNDGSDALRTFALLGDDKSGFPQPANNSDSPANAGQRPAARGERPITLARLQFVTGLGTRTSSRR
jgi:hypothetical protein